MEKGDWLRNIESESEITLNVTSNQWPGSVYSSLIAIHWEVVLEFLETNGRRILWVFSRNYAAI